MSEYIEKPLTVKELTSKAGKASVAGLTKEELTARGTRASHARKCYDNIPKASHSGKITIGNKIIDCAVLDNGIRVIMQKSLQIAIGKTPKGSSRKNARAQLPAFLEHKNLEQFLTQEIIKDSIPIIFKLPKGGIAHGFKAELLPEVCDIYLKARDAGSLPHNQQHIAKECDIIVRALSKVGLIGLIDESSGYQHERDRDELQKLLSKYISAELLPWTRRFPQKFFDAYKKMYNVCNDEKCPSHIGYFINSCIYDELAPNILDELKKKNPKEENGKRRHAHHQFLTEDIGVDALQKQLIEVTTLMKISKDKDQFKELYKLSRE